MNNKNYSSLLMGIIFIILGIITLIGMDTLYKDIQKHDREFSKTVKYLLATEMGWGKCQD